MFKNDHNTKAKDEIIDTKIYGSMQYTLENVPEIFEKIVLNPKVRVIDLTNIPLEKDELNKLYCLIRNRNALHKKRSLTGVQSLILKNTGLKANNLPQLNKILESIPECSILDLSDNNLGSDGLLLLIEKICNSHIQYLDVSNVKANNLNLFNLIKCLKTNKHLAQIDLTGNFLEKPDLLLSLLSTLENPIELKYGELFLNSTQMKELITSANTQSFSQLLRGKSGFSESEPKIGTDRETKRARYNIPDKNEINNSILTCYKMLTPNRLKAILKCDRITNYKISDEKTTDARYRTDSRSFSITRPKSKFDERFHIYGFNQLPSGNFICEGPSPQNKESVTDFLTELFSNPELNSIENIIVVGTPTDGEGYYDYFSENSRYGNYEISTQSLHVASPNVAEFYFLITHQKTKKKFLLTHVTGRENNGLKLDPLDLKRLYEICLNLKGKIILAHCDTGLFSPIILFAFHLFYDFTQIFSGENDSISEKILGLLENYRNTFNVALIPKKELLVYAIELAVFFMKIHMERLCSNDQNIPQIHKSIPIKSVCILGQFADKTSFSTLMEEPFFNLGINVLPIDLGSNVPHKIKLDGYIEKIISDVISDFAVIKILRLYHEKRFHTLLICDNLNEKIICKILEELPDDLKKTCIVGKGSDSFINFLCHKQVSIEYKTPTDEKNPDNSYYDVINKIYGSLRMTQQMSSGVFPPMVDQKGANIVIHLPVKCLNLTFINSFKLYSDQMKLKLRKLIVDNPACLEELTYLVNNDKVKCIIEMPNVEIVNDITNQAGVKYNEEIEMKPCRYIIIPGGADYALSTNPYGKYLTLTDHLFAQQTTEEENKMIGYAIANHANKLVTKGHIVDILIPCLGFSDYEDSWKWQNALAQNLLISAIKEKIISNDKLKIYELSSHINDESFLSQLVQIINISPHQRKFYFFNSTQKDLQSEQLESFGSFPAPG